jgi:hypothetical protein
MLMIAGTILFVIGLAVTYGDRIPFLGRLPGDIHFEGKGSSFHFPVVTCIVISVIATVVLNFLGRK